MRLNGRTRRRAVGASLLCGLVIAGLGWTVAAGQASRGVTASEPFLIEAITKASGDVRLAFEVPGRVMQPPVREGSIVKAGEPVIRLDDRTPALQLAILKARAASTAELDAAIASHELAQNELKQFERAFSEAGAGEFELERKRLEVKLTEARKTIQELARAEAAQQVEAAQLGLSRYTLLSPIDGTVEQVLVSAGETVEALRPVIRIVAIDPLRLDVSVPAAVTVRMNAGDPVWVRIPLEGVDGYREGRVQSIGRVAEAGTGTVTVRVQLPNPDGIPAGTTALVSVDRPEGAQ